MSAVIQNRTVSPIPLVFVAAVISALLSGCQSIPLLSDNQPEHIVWNSKPDNIASHEFNLSSDQGIVGTLASISSRENDTLSDIGRHYGLGYNDITIANANLDPWTLPAEQTVLLPLRFVLPDAPRKGIVLNLANMRMFYYPKNQA